MHKAGRQARFLSLTGTVPIIYLLQNVAVIVFASWAEKLDPEEVQR